MSDRQLQLAGGRQHYVERVDHEHSVGVSVDAKKITTMKWEKRTVEKKEVTWVTPKGDKNK